MGSQRNELNVHLKLFENTQFSDEFLDTFELSELVQYIIFFGILCALAFVICCFLGQFPLFLGLTRSV